MLRIFIMTLSFIALVIVNGAANIVPFNGSTYVEISNRIPILFTPASYVLLIWFVIYSLITVWLFGFWKERNNLVHPLSIRRSIFFILGSVFNIIQIMLWHYEFFTLSFITLAALLVTLSLLYLTYPSDSNRLFGRIPIAVYLAWIIFTFITNILYVLTLHEWSGWGLSAPLWTVIYLTIATAIALHFIYHYHDIAFTLVFIWVFTGIAVKNGFEELFVTSAALFLVMVLFVTIFILPRKNKSKAYKIHHSSSI